MNTAINLEELKTAWRVAKAAEDAANAERLRVEAAIVALMPSKLEGSVTDAGVTDAGVTVTFKVTRKVDAVALQNDWHTMPESVQQAFAWKPSVDARHLRALEGYELTTAQTYFTTTPAKPAIAIKD